MQAEAASSEDDSKRGFVKAPADARSYLCKSRISRATESDTRRLGVAAAEPGFVTLRTCPIARTSKSIESDESDPGESGRADSDPCGTRRACPPLTGKEAEEPLTAGPLPPELFSSVLIPPGVRGTLAADALVWPIPAALLGAGLDVAPPWIASASAFAFAFASNLALCWTSRTAFMYSTYFSFASPSATPGPSGMRRALLLGLAMKGREGVRTCRWMVGEPYVNIDLDAQKYASATTCPLLSAAARPRVRPSLYLCYRVLPKPPGPHSLTLDRCWREHWVGMSSSAPGAPSSDLGTVCVNTSPPCVPSLAAQGARAGGARTRLQARRSAPCWLPCLNAR
jgi:hypothetical protein